MDTLYPSTVALVFRFGLGCWQAGHVHDCNEQKVTSFQPRGTGHSSVGASTRASALQESHFTSHVFSWMIGTSATLHAKR
jgi:hypothetical protein